MSRSRSLLYFRNARICKRHKELCALKKYRVDFIITMLENEFYLKGKTIYGILRVQEPDIIPQELPIAV